MYPVHPEVELPEAFVNAGGATDIVNMDEEIVAEKLDGWLAAWEELMRK
jgi:ABC-type thiamine transport system substrate-binding protein